MPENTQTTKRSHYKEKDHKNYWDSKWPGYAGLTPQHIANTLGVSVSTVQSYIKQADKTDTPSSHAPPGTVINQRGKSHLTNIVKDNPFLSFNGAKQKLKSFGVHVSRGTAISYLRSMGFDSFYAVKKPTLEKYHKVMRLGWGH